MTDADTEPDRARFLGLCASSRYAEAEPMVALVYANGSMPGGSEVLARAGFYEEWGDAVAGIDSDAARTAYVQAEEFYALYASWSPAGGEGQERQREVVRVGDKIAELTGSR